MTKRGVIFEVTEEALEQFLRASLQIPSNAEVVGMHYDSERRAIGVKVWHVSYPVVPEGAPYERRLLELKPCR